MSTSLFVLIVVLRLVFIYMSERFLLNNLEMSIFFRIFALNFKHYE